MLIFVKLHKIVIVRVRPEVDHLLDAPKHSSFLLIEWGICAFLACHVLVIIILGAHITTAVPVFDALAHLLLLLNDKLLHLLVSLESCLLKFVSLAFLVLCKSLCQRLGFRCLLGLQLSFAASSLRVLTHFALLVVFGAIKLKLDLGLASSFALQIIRMLHLGFQVKLCNRAGVLVELLLVLVEDHDAPHILKRLHQFYLTDILRNLYIGIYCVLVLARRLSLTNSDFLNRIFHH